MIVLRARTLKPQIPLPRRQFPLPGSRRRRHRLLFQTHPVQLEEGILNIVVFERQCGSGDGDGLGLSPRFLRRRAALQFSLEGDHFSP